MCAGASDECEASNWDFVHPTRWLFVLKCFCDIFCNKIYLLSVFLVFHAFKVSKMFAYIEMRSGVRFLCLVFPTSLENVA